MNQISLKDQILKLVELQKIDAQIYEIKRDLEEKPIFMNQLKESFEQSKQKFNDLEKRFKQMQLEKKDGELELKEKEENITKANRQLTELKTNKEYSAKLSEIESLKADKSVIEDKILQFFELIDNVSLELEKEKIKVSEQEKVFLTKKKEVDDQIEILNDRIKVLDTQRKQYTADIDPIYLRRYEKILHRKAGIAIVSLHDQICGGCFMEVTSQMINEIKMLNRLVECENCTRILYLEEFLS